MLALQQPTGQQVIEYKLKMLGQWTEWVEQQRVGSQSI